MTEEEAINCLYAYSSTNGSGLCTDNQHYEAKQMAIKALVQELCDDYNSRQAVLEQTYEWSKDEFLRVTNPFDYLRKRINSLPPDTPQQEYEDITKAFQLGLAFGFAKKYDEMDKIMEEIINTVTPQPKTGHWIDDKCSVCGKGIEDLISSSEWYRNEEPNFCPFCGVKLVDPQES